MEKHGLFVSNRPCQLLSATYESLNKTSIHPIVSLPGLNVLPVAYQPQELAW